MTEIRKVLDRYRVELPKEYRDFLGIEKGAYIEIDRNGNELIIRKHKLNEELDEK